jgi:hypothetical protein
MFSEHFDSFTLDLKADSILINGPAWRPIDFDSIAHKFSMEVQPLLELLRSAATRKSFDDRFVRVLSCFVGSHHCIAN